MLKSLLIENYALIEKLDISFDDGLTIITGETGAGKSILLGALGLILGNRADSHSLLNKDGKCVIEGIFSLKDLHLESLFEENDLDFEETTILRREINNQGKSRAFINDTPVNLNVLKAVAERLIDIHSQHQTLLFSNPGFRYNLLDAWSGLAGKMIVYRQSYAALTLERKELEKLRDKEKQTRTELDYFIFQHDELFKAELIPGEETEIEAELDVLNNAGTIKYNLEKADFILEHDSDNILTSLKELISLFKAVENFHPTYASLHERIQSATIELKDIAAEVAALKEDVADDPQRSAALQQRYDLLQKLMHKHHAADVAELIEIRDNFAEKIESFESLEREIERLTISCSEKESQVRTLATEISASRQKGIESLENEINSLLKELAMPNGRFSVRLTPRLEPGVYGLDELNFLFSANLGAPLQELDKVASGGEMSRLMLAVKSVISMKNLLPTIIFDEIDSGVSGEIGLKMGKILSRIAQNMQVISVTHLPQVAARGQKHFVVYKTTENNTTKTYIKEVRNQERIMEVAKMMGGENPGTALLQAAEELFDKQNIHEKHI
jgi:DNA repair protein RecN (Recombination protein N)